MQTKLYCHTYHNHPYKLLLKLVKIKFNHVFDNLTATIDCWYKNYLHGQTAYVN